MFNDNRPPYSDLKTVESQRNDLAAEEFPDGSYGSNRVQAESLSTNRPWRIEQRSPNRFDYENHELHAGIERDYPGDDTYPDAMDEP
ncbi:hypothetical protein A8990_1528 [Paenibacillus taihuensis]|uniref:Uncharacterized protein n=1 Tax=Paenibacillus taihuensis TaxID=1156355 RepID=A0A3D9Q3V9_9BACL|nr:hypothetical protein [Paenibacillus taihuensis]REE57563.1 hypothetical protein A8990_1528 [Paenibacillus taihuensis]